MKTSRVVVAFVLVAGLTAPATAGDLLAAVSKSSEPQPPLATQRSMPKAYLWPGVALFAGGMAVAINGFLNNRNGEFPQFGEAESTNVRMGAAGLTAAFGGGVLLGLGKHRAGRAPSLTVGSGRVTVSKRITW